MDNVAEVNIQGIDGGFDSNCQKDVLYKRQSSPIIVVGVNNSQVMRDSQDTQILPDPALQLSSPPSPRFQLSDPPSPIIPLPFSVSQIGATIRDGMRAVYGSKVVRVNDFLRDDPLHYYNTVRMKPSEYNHFIMTAPLEATQKGMKPGTTKIKQIYLHKTRWSFQMTDYNSRPMASVTMHQQPSNRVVDSSLQ